jgi:hypothetical protein
MAGSERLCTAFEGERRIARGALAQVAIEVKRVVDRGESAPVLIFDDETSEQVEVDLRGTVEDVTRRLERPVEESEEVPRGPGRPRLGVVAREVTLLPRHWEWLNTQPGGTSVTLRKLVEAARRANGETDRRRAARDAAYHFMSAMAGNLPQFEEASRALFAEDHRRFTTLIAAWPGDVRDHILRLAFSPDPVDPANMNR